MPRRSLPRKCPGFTRVDLVVATLVSLVAVNLLLASAARVRDAAEQAQSRNNLKQLGIAMHNVFDSLGKLPPALGGFYPSETRSPSSGYGPCLFHILPYIEQDNLYKFSLTNLPGGPLFACWKGKDHPIKLFWGPGDPTVEKGKPSTSYLANGLAFPTYFGAGFPSTGPRTWSQFTDGTSNTILFAEGYAKAVGTMSDGTTAHSWTVERRWWDDPVWIPYASGVTFQVAPVPEEASASLPQGLTRSGLQVVMADYSCHTVAPSCSAKTFYEACTPSGGEVLASDW